MIQSILLDECAKYGLRGFVYSCVRNSAHSTQDGKEESTVFIYIAQPIFMPKETNSSNEKVDFALVNSLEIKARFPNKQRRTITKIVSIHR